ncbi:HAD family hydrolase [Cohnella abietis]|uniref:Noncanonical pyrimidine nucleotidase, YjjG family protein n=1 Tax=Cohnella abietis TaxID=2507935 RepID=A0A3T1DET9_9BACL|nr:HAD-IA family hydrolase [Cohnella abietis]BBI36488.1 noncanonical pyrimidine nucleotidase, YjjG family protein [Cohnella abietis]
MNYKAIIFDLDNTLLNYSASELKSMQQTVQTHGLIHHESFTWDSFWIHYSKINMYYWNERNKSGHNIYQILELSFQDTLKELRLDHSDSKLLANLYWDTFCNACDFEEHATDILSHLHGKYNLAIISNGIGQAQRCRLAVGKIEHYFDALVISDEVGYWKPDKEIFAEALKRLNIHHSEALFVGDSLNDDYFGALNAGIDFCYYNRMSNPIDTSIRPKFMIDSLNKISDFLASQ